MWVWVLLQSLKLLCYCVRIAAYLLKNENIYYDWLYLQMQIIQGHSQHLKIVTRSYILYVGRVLHPPQSKTTAMCKLMQGNIRDFSISTLKNIPLKKITVVFHKKNNEIQGHSVDKERYAMEEKTYINV